MAMTPGAVVMIALRKGVEERGVQKIPVADATITACVGWEYWPKN
jgi:hypothetical protein